MSERLASRARGLIFACGLAPILLLTYACTEPDPNVIVRVEIRHADGRRITPADSLAWYTPFHLQAIALNGSGDPIPDQSVTWDASGAIVRDPFGRSLFRVTGVGTGTITATIGDKTAQVSIKTYLPASELVWPWPNISRMLVGMSRTLVVRTVDQ